jgi:chaperonin GroEL
MTEHTGFAATIRAAPHDTTARMIFADWLTERSDPRADCIRLAVRLRANYGPLHPNHSRSFWQEIGQGLESSWWVAEVQRVAEEVMDTVGDGGKTAALIALALAEGSLLFPEGDEDVADSLRNNANRAVEAVTRLTAPTTSRGDVRAALLTAAHGSAVLADPLLSAFEQAGRDGIIRIEQTAAQDQPHARAHVQEGLRFPLAGLEEQDGRALRSVNVLVALRPLRVAEARRALTVALPGTTGLLCCCPGLAPDAAELFRDPETRARTILCATADGRWRDCFEDVAAATGARLIGPDQGPVTITAQRLGRAGAARVDGGHLVLEDPAGPRGGGPNWIAHLRQLLYATTGAEQEWHSERLGQLAGNIVTVEVGGSSPAETDQLYGRACGALHAGRTMIAEGFVPGGGVAYLRAAAGLDGRLGPALCWALEEPCRALLVGTRLTVLDTLTALRADEGLGLDVVRQELLPWREDGPIDPLRVVRTAIERAVGSACRAVAAGQIPIPERTCATDAVCRR